MWNADLGYYYGKRFQLDAQMKVQNMLGENKDHKITILTDHTEPIFRVNFVDNSKPAIDIEMSAFIDIKSAKAKGKRFSLVEVALIEDISPEIVVDVEPNEENETLDNHPSTTEDVLDKVDVPFTISNEFPEDSKPIDEQLSLF